VNAADLFFRAQGDPRASRDPQMQQGIAILAANFPTQADRNWLRLFVQSLQDESNRFFHAYWTGEQQTRGAAYAAFQEQWLSRYYPKLAISQQHSAIRRTAGAFNSARRRRADDQ
jgi:hypothetical protein